MASCIKSVAVCKFQNLHLENAWPKLETERCMWALKDQSRCTIYGKGYEVVLAGGTLYGYNIQDFYMYLVIGSTSS